MEKQDTITLTYEEYSALCSVVDYLHDDELKHYEEEPNSKHIWHSVKTLSLALKKIQQLEEK
jgi:hypothetical protein|tara:strand:+ start:289 stop:474 length:186 start_codon:yes stop_codon:yes gene_type:complete